MKYHDSVFYAIVFFLVGILLTSAHLSFPIILLLSFWTATIFLLLYFHYQYSLLINVSSQYGSSAKILLFERSPDSNQGEVKKYIKYLWLAGLSAFIIVGSGYFLFDDSRFRNFSLPIGEEADFTGLIINDPEVGSKIQKLVVETRKPYQGRVLIQLNSRPAFHYGDLIEVTGTIKLPDDDRQENFLAKERITGTVTFPQKITTLKANRGFALKAWLFQLKNYSLGVFKKSLSPEKSALLGGLTLGQRSDFSPEFKESMNLSGTTHLVALSGYNIQVIVAAVATTLGYFLKRRSQFILTILVIVGFVMMTGAEASIVRAAAMGIIALLAQQTNRVYNFRNAISFAAFLMVLINPKVLFFDLGFQLSFFALLGIVYLKPALMNFLRISRETKTRVWAENALTTIAAQLAVLPLLISNFKFFSLASFAANILILEIIPLTMFLGFLMIGVSFLSSYLALIIGWLANFFLIYVTFMINIFSKLKFLIVEVNNLSIVFSVFYFIMLAIFTITQLKNSRKEAR